MTSTGTKDLFAYAESNRPAILYLAQNMVNGDCYNARKHNVTTLYGRRFAYVEGPEGG